MCLQIVANFSIIINDTFATVDIINLTINLFPEAAVKAGSDEADQAVQEVITEDTKKYLKNFEDKVAQLEKFTQDSIKDYSNHDVKLKDDLKTLGLKSMTSRSTC